MWMAEKSKIREVLDNLVDGVIIWLEGEEKPLQDPPLYTREEKMELYGIKKDIERYPKHADDA